MIGNSICWRFIEPIMDAGFFEDEIVEHLGTLHRARRRCFNAKLSKDEHALSEICRQASLMGNVQHPALPRYYGGELVEGQYTIVDELIEGGRFIDLGTKGGNQGILDWCDNVVRLCEELAPLEALRVDYSRLRSNQIVVTTRGRLRFTTTWPVGTVSRERIDGSPFLARLVASPFGGMFVADGPPDPGPCMDAIQGIVFHLAAGKDTRSVAEALEEERREMAQTGARELPSCIGLEKSLGELILSIRRPDGTREITSLQALSAAARKLRKRTAQRMEEERTGRRAAATGQSSANLGRIAPGTAPASSPAVPKPAITHDSSGPFFPTAASPMAAAREMATPRDEPLVKPRPKAIDGPPADQKLEYVKAAEEVDEDAAAALYPKRPDVVVAAGGQEVRVTELPKASSPRLRLFRNLFLAAVGIGIAGAVAFHFIKIASTPLNQPPTAVISKAPTRVLGIEKVRFEARGSTDPEQKPLTYHWKVIERQPADYRFIPNDSAEAVSTEAQFFTGGKVMVELRVFDGSLFSEPVTAEVDIVPTGR